MWSLRILDIKIFYSKGNSHSISDINFVLSEPFIKGILLIPFEKTLDMSHTLALFWRFSSRVLLQSGGITSK